MARPAGVRNLHPESLCQQCRATHLLWDKRFKIVDLGHSSQACAEGKGRQNLTNWTITNWTETATMTRQVRQMRVNSIEQGR